MNEVALAHNPLPTTIGGLRSRASELADKLSRTTARMKKVKDENQERVEGFLGAAVVVGSASAISYAAARYGKVGAAAQVMGFDADLVAGGVLFALGLFEMGGKYNAFLYDMGAGGLAAYGTREAYAMGVKAQQSAGHPAIAATGGVRAASAYAAGVQPAAAWAPRQQR